MLASLRDQVGAYVVSTYVAKTQLILKDKRLPISRYQRWDKEANAAAG